jgi:hypothetical protein
MASIPPGWIDDVQDLVHSDPFRFVAGAAAVISVGFGALGFRHREFMTLHNVSVNIFHKKSQQPYLLSSNALDNQAAARGSSEPSVAATVKGKKYEFRFRTIMERPLVSMLGHNKHATSIVMAAARRIQPRPFYKPWRRWAWWNRRFGEVKQASPFIHLSNADDQVAISMCIGNQISQLSAEGFLREAAGLPVHRRRFVFGITCEDSGLFTKTRTQLICEETLREIAALGDDVNESTVEVEHARNRFRLNTVKLMAIEYRKNPQQFHVIELAFSPDRTLP